MTGSTEQEILVVDGILIGTDTAGKEQKIKLGDEYEGEIYHDGTNLNIKNTDAAGGDIIFTLGNTDTTTLFDIKNSANASKFKVDGAGTVTITGDLSVTGGTTTTISTTNTIITDKIIELANGTTGTPSGDSGIVIERGDSDNIFMGWDESADTFVLGTGSFTGASTGDLTVTPAKLSVATGSTIGNLTLANGSITDSGGAITFGNENLTTTGTLGVTGISTFTAQSVHTGGIQTGSNILSDTDSTDDLGSTSVRWANVYTDSVGDTGQALAVAATTVNMAAGTLSFDGVHAIDTSGNNALTISSGSGTTTMTAGTVAIGTNATVGGTLTASGIVKVGASAGSGVDAYLYTSGTAAHVGIQWDADGETEGILIGGADGHGVDFKFSVKPLENMSIGICQEMN